MGMKYDFDKIIDRTGTHAMSLEGYEDYLFGETEGLDIKYPPEDMIRMWVADMEFETSVAIVNSLRQRIDHGIFGYTQRKGAAYISAFAQWTKERYDWSLNTDHLVSAKGVIPVLYKLINYTCKPHGSVLITTPSYAFFKHAADYNKVPLIKSDLINNRGHYTMDYEDIAYKIAHHNVSLFILCHPHNPTGRVWMEDELKKLTDLCLENDVFIIADEIHCDIVRNGVRFRPLASLYPDSDKIITCMAPSKTFNLAGFMFANVVIPNNTLRERWNSDHLPIENPLSLTAAHAAYAAGHDWLHQMNLYLDKNFVFASDYLKVHLPQAIHSIPAATYLMWIDLSAYFQKEENLTLFFANKAGVLLEGGDMFVDNADGFIRLNLACPRSKVEEGLKRICAAINAKSS